MTKTAVVAGATGAVGQKLVPLLLDAPDYAHIKLLSRRPLALAHPRLEVIVADFERLDELGTRLAGDDVYCCLGTTQRQEGRDGLVKVDHDYVLNLARAALDQGAKQFLVVSAVGSHAHSPSFYARVKGQMEQELAALGYPALHIVRPSLLLAAREESRPAEQLAQRLSPLFRPFLVGPLARYRPVPVGEVAGALLQLSRRPFAGVEIHHLPLKD